MWSVRNVPREELNFYVDSVKKKKKIQLKTFIILNSIPTSQYTSTSKLTFFFFWKNCLNKKDIKKDLYNVLRKVQVSWLETRRGVLSPVYAYVIYNYNLYIRYTCIYIYTGRYIPITIIIYFVYIYIYIVYI